jgi:hypothetical protein
MSSGLQHSLCLVASKLRCAFEQVIPSKEEDLDAHCKQRAPLLLIVACDVES